MNLYSVDLSVQIIEATDLYIATYKVTMKLEPTILSLGYCSDYYK